MLQDRRQFVGLGMAATILFATRVAAAQVYPSRPVRLVVGFTAGGIADVIARLIAQQLSSRLGQSFIIENHPGAGSTLAMEAVARAAPDGYTLLLMSSTNAINESLQRNRNFSLLTDILPVASIYRNGAGVMVVRQSSSIQSLLDFIAFAKAHPGKLNFASAGVGTTQHLYGEMFKTLTGITMNHIPYRGAPLAISDLLAGHVQVMFDTLGNCLPHIRAERLRALGVTTRSRTSALPDVPAIGELVPRYEGSGWQGVGAPKNTPANIVAALNREINVVLDDSAVNARLTELGYTPFRTEPEEFGQFIAIDVARWAKVTAFAAARAN